MVILFEWHTPVSWAYTPADPVVREVVSKGLTFLQTTDEREDRPGALALVGLVLLKEGHGDDHPRVVRAVEAGRKLLSDPLALKQMEIYSPGICLIFLCELETLYPGKYLADIRSLVASLLDVQKPAGGWGYSNLPTGDTSMTQYAVLGLWSARNAGLEIPRDRVVRVCNWLMRVQDPSGAWGYQGVDDGTTNRQPQTGGEFRLSLCAASLSSLHICGDMLALGQQESADRKNVGDSPLPSVLKRVRDPAPTNLKGKATRPKPLSVDRADWRRSLQDGHEWLKQNFRVDPTEWPLYYLYALERSESFREKLHGSAEAEPAWYNEGVDYLKKEQMSSGAWDGRAGPTASTAFAILFLIRSAQRTIERVVPQEGTLQGGKGVPGAARPSARQKRSLDEAPEGSVHAALAILEDPQHPDYARLTDDLEAFQLADDPELQQRQVARLRRLLQAGSYRARLLAVRTLAARNHLDDAPHLIAALRDPDPDVAAAADSALVTLSRRLETPDVDRRSRDNTGSGPRILMWKQWYRTLRPDAEMVE